MGSTIAQWLALLLHSSRDLGSNPGLGHCLCGVCVFSPCHRIIEFLQCRWRPFGPSSPHRQQSHPGPIPVIPHTHPANLPDTRVNLTWPINLTRTSLDCGRKPEYPEETHADMGRTCRLHTVSDPRLELNPGSWRCEAAVLTTVPPCRPSWGN